MQEWEKQKWGTAHLSNMCSQIFSIWCLNVFHPDSVVQKNWKEIQKKKNSKAIFSSRCVSADLEINGVKENEVWRPCKRSKAYLLQWINSSSVSVIGALSVLHLMEMCVGGMIFIMLVILKPPVNVVLC